ncbi:MAG: FAD:protein FMN transferase [Bradyrhizobiaceae bacterium]|nr:FAD:protein FMN transferase [Bradyrhizobiaceae bacterium]
MGADATIHLSGIRPGEARAAVEMVVAEIGRLESALSLFRADSEICRLNREGRLPAAQSELRRALALGLAVAETTNGLFDPTVQALWEAYVDWFTADPDAGALPEEELAVARAAVDWRRVHLADGLVEIGQGQRITLNGLGQGYVTDRVAALLRARGLRHVLVDLGEQLAIGPRADGQAWRVARTDGDTIRLTEGALATSAGAGCPFGANGLAHHLFDPRTGLSARHWRHLTVYNRSAAVADALSTAFYAAPADEIAALVARVPETHVWATDLDGSAHHWGWPPSAGLML